MLLLDRVVILINAHLVSVQILAAQEKIAQRASERGVLLVRVKDLPSKNGGTGMLTERQKQWLNTATYDSKTENPVLHRCVHGRVLSD